MLSQPILSSRRRKAGLCSGPTICSSWQRWCAVCRREVAAMCKANYVHYVKRKMSVNSPSLLHPASYSVCNVSMDADVKRSYVQIKLDIQFKMYIIMFTREHAEPTTNETIILARAGNAECSRESGATRELSRQRVLRSGRFGTGQVRDAAAGGCRK